MTLPTYPDPVDFSRLAASFERGIERVLRGFRPPGSPEWLDLWVHDEDHVRSILNIFEAAEASGLPGATVWVESAQQEGLDEERMAVVLSPLGETDLVRSAQGLSITVRFGRGDEAPATAASDAPTARAPKAAAPVVLERRIDADQTPYEAGMAEVLASPRHEGELSPSGHGHVVSACIGSVTLAARIDPAHRVVEAAHRGAEDGLPRAILETLCRIMPGRPLEDCAQHATQVAHARLCRSPSAVPGIAMPHNCHPDFAPPERLTRVLLAEYCQRTGYEPGATNFHHAGPDAAWRELADGERQERVQQILDRACPELEVPPGRCISAEAGGSVALGFPEPIPSTEGWRLLRLEDRIKRDLDEAIYIHLEEMKDLNRLRVLEGRGSSE